MAEDVQGIPNVTGLEVLVSDDGGQSPDPSTQQSAEQQTQINNEQKQAQGTPKPEQSNLAQFKTPEDLLKSYKEVQGAFTRTSQENKALKDNLAQMNEQIELIRLSQMHQPVQQQQPQPQQRDFDQQFLDNPEKAIESLAERKAQSLFLQSKIQDVLEEESLKAPQEFNERYGYAKLVSQQYPQLVTSTAGVRKLFQLGDKLRMDEQKSSALKAVKAVFGDDVDFERMRTLLKRDTAPGVNNNNNAYMPDTSNTGGNKSESTPVNIDAEINEAVSKGNPDAVISALFRQRGLR